MKSPLNSDSPGRENRALLDILRVVERGTAGVTGNSFFRALAKTCSEVFGVDCVFVTQCVGRNRERVEVLAFWNRGRFEDEGLIYELADTPCQRVISGHPLKIERGLQGLFPNDDMLVTLRADSYVGVPLADMSGQVLGHFVLLNTVSLTDIEERAVEIIALGVAAELERVMSRGEYPEKGWALEEVIDSAPICIAYVDQDERYRFVNKSYEVWHKLSRSEILGSTIESVLGERAYRSIKGYVSGALQGQAQSFSLNAKYTASNRSVDALYQPVVGPGNDVQGFFAIIVDVSEQVRLQKAVTEIGQRERLRLGNDLHDGLGQELVAISLRLASLEKDLGKPQEVVKEEIGQLKDLVGRSLEKTRNLARLASPMSVELDLGRMLQRMSKDIAAVYGIDCHVHADGVEKPTTEAIAAELYWIVQEASANAVRHGGAHSVDIYLSVDNGELNLRIEDDGSGIMPSDHPSEGLGLKILDYRARLLSGEIELSNRNEGGTRLIVRCPLPLPRNNTS